MSRDGVDTEQHVYASAVRISDCRPITPAKVDEADKCDRVHDEMVVAGRASEVRRCRPWVVEGEDGQEVVNGFEHAK